VQPHVGALTWGSVEVKDGGVVSEMGLEEGKGKRGEGWSFTFPPVGGKKKVPVERTRGAST
jgi:hypothetical protein